MKKVLVLLALAIILTSGCITTDSAELRLPIGALPPGGEAAVTRCLEICKQKLSRRTDLSVGPCLANQVDTDWVCDVVHSPRQEVDNLPENQCSAWREASEQGRTMHFVEVDLECNFIRAV